MFDDKHAEWLAHQQTPWARLFYRLSEAHIQRHLDLNSRSLRILDLGGGNGLQALGYAQRGHCVTIVDVSEEMLASAAQGAAQLGVSERVTVFQADLADFLPPSEWSFDLVLCHNVIQYVGVEPVLKAAAVSAREGGYLSLIGINQYSEPLRKALHDQDFQGARDSLHSNSYRSRVFDTDMMLFTTEDLIRPLKEHGFDLVQHYGIRCVNDYIEADELKHDSEVFDQLEALETELSVMHPYRLLGRYYQLIATLNMRR